MNKKKLPALAIMLITTAVMVLPGHEAHAGSQQIDSACREKQTEDSLEQAACLAYIQGFLEGALVTDKAIVSNITTGDNQNSAFLRRAYQTRVGTTHQALPATYLAEFCIPADVSTAEVVLGVRQKLVDTDPNKTTIADAVYSTLKSLYPCSQSAPTKHNGASNPQLHPGLVD